ncbi:hypothetical protein EON65_49855 [archaeon]|nr:MAG: hypothetical protein EON65_49855 [archaeon]
MRYCEARGTRTSNKSNDFTQGSAIDELGALFDLQCCLILPQFLSERGRAHREQLRLAHCIESRATVAVRQGTRQKVEEVSEKIPPVPTPSVVSVCMWCMCM